MVFAQATSATLLATVNVLGQATFTTNIAATTQTELRSPCGLAVDTSNRLFVADATNFRVIVFDIATIADGEAAVNVLGQVDFVTAVQATSQTGLKSTEDVVSFASARLFAADTGNQEMMVFDIGAISNGEPAVYVLGQTTFTVGGASVSQSRLNSPNGVLLQGSLLYTGDASNRVMVFDVLAITNGENAGLTTCMTSRTD